MSPAVASMSLGGGVSTAMNDVIKEMFDAGIVVCVAGGNDNDDACLGSPAMAPEVNCLYLS